MRITSSFTRLPLYRHALTAAPLVFLCVQFLMTVQFTDVICSITLWRPPVLKIRLSSGMTIEIDPSAWPIIGDAVWTTQREGGVVTAHVVIRRHTDGRTVMYVDANPGEGPLVNGDLLPPAAAEIEEAIRRFGASQEMPDWVAERCVQSVRG
jgi:hypothetical protein